MINEKLRLRVFAGPNGSGKSTIIHALRSREFNARPLDSPDSNDLPQWFIKYYYDKIKQPPAE